MGWNVSDNSEFSKKNSNTGPEQIAILPKLAAAFTCQASVKSGKNKLVYNYGICDNYNILTNDGDFVAPKAESITVTIQLHVSNATSPGGTVTVDLLEDDTSILSKQIPLPTAGQPVGAQRFTATIEAKQGSRYTITYQFSNSPDAKAIFSPFTNFISLDSSGHRSGLQMALCAFDYLSGFSLSPNTELVTRRDSSNNALRVFALELIKDVTHV